jgi:hypothetical protein
MGGEEEDVEMGMEDMGDEMDSDEEEMDFNVDDEEMGMDDEEFDTDDETVDLTGASDDEVLKVFKAMGDEDGIIVKREDDMIHLEDGEDEYLVQLGESYMEEDEDLTMSDFELGEGESDTLYEIEFTDSDEESEEEDEDEDYEINNWEDASNWIRNTKKGQHAGKRPISDFDDLEEGFEDDFSEDDFSEEDYSEEDYSEQFEEEEMVSLEDQIMEALKSKMKPKGEGIGHGPKFSYDKKPNMGGGFNEKKKEGPKSVGTGKAKFEYKEGKEFGSKKHEYKRKKVDGVEKKAGEDKDGHYKDYEKSETKEAVRTNSYPRANKVGNRKGSNQNTNREEIRVRPNTRSVNEEVEILRERNEEYKKALDIFRTKLNEVAIFNSNLAYATRLFTEHSTTKQEKINILRRFDEVESLKESKNLYRTMKGELTNTTSNEKTITESIEKTVRTPASGSAVNLIESKTYENPQFLRMKDLMSKIN